MIYYPHRRASHRMPPWDLSSNTFVHYKCNDNAASTVVTDDGSSSTNGISSTNTSNLTATAKTGTASFDFTSASSEYVDMNQTLQATVRATCAFSFWIKPNDGQPAEADIFYGTNEATTGDGLNILYDTAGKIRVFLRIGGTQKFALTNAAVFADGAANWTNVGINISASQIDIYIDTVQVALDGTQDGDISALTLANYVCTVNPSFGAWNDNGTRKQHMDGFLDDFRIMDRVMVQDEINGIYNNGSGTEAQSN